MAVSYDAYERQPYNDNNNNNNNNYSTCPTNEKVKWKKNKIKIRNEKGDCLTDIFFFLLISAIMNTLLDDEYLWMTSTH